MKYCLPLHWFIADEPSLLFLFIASRGIVYVPGLPSLKNNLTLMLC